MKPAEYGNVNARVVLYSVRFIQVTILVCEKIKLTGVLQSIFLKGLEKTKSMTGS